MGHEAIFHSCGWTNANFDTLSRCRLPPNDSNSTGDQSERGCSSCDTVRADNVASLQC